MTRVVVPDFESLSPVDLKKAGAYRYWEDARTEILCLSWAVDDGPFRTWFPLDDTAELHDLAADPAVIMVPHNAQFEKQGWRQKMVKVFGLPDIPNGRWHCSQARAANLVIPQKLDQLTRLSVLGFGQDGGKDMEGSRLVVGWSRAYAKTGVRPEITAAQLKRCGTYCETDVREQRQVHNRLGWLDPGERRVYLYDQRINERGVRLDVPLVRQMQKIVDDASVPLAAEFRRITGLNMTQVAKVGGWLMEQGVVLPNMQKDTLAAVLGETDEGEEIDEDDRIKVDLPGHVERALRIRQLIGSASVKKLGAMDACVMRDGRARGLLNYHGAGPGRWAGRIIQPQNFPRGTLRVDGKAPDIDALVAALMTGDHEWVEMCYGTGAVEVVLSALRHTIISEDDRVLVAGDYAGIEARLTLAVAGAHEKTALMASGADVYCDMASDIFGRPITKADVEERQIGKNSVLGLGFQMGAAKFCARYCADKGLEFAQRVVDAYRGTWAPEVPDVWHALDRAAREAVWTGRAHEAYGVRYMLEDCWLTARLPSGRKLWYFNPQKTRRAMPWDPDDIRPGWSYQATKQGQLRTVDAFGGLLTENLAQGLARDLLVCAIEKAEAERFPVVLTVHDEVVCEPERSRDTNPKELLRQIMVDIPDWAKEIKVPVASETWEGPRYRK